MAATLSHIFLRRRLWVARLTVPPDVQAVIGKKVFSRSTGETSKARAGVKAEVFVAGWKKQIDEAREANRRAPSGVLSQHEIDFLKGAWMAGELEIVEDAMMALVPDGMTNARMTRAWERQKDPGYAAGQPSQLEAMAAAVPAISVALDEITGARTPFLKHKAVWAASLKMKARPKAQYIRDVDLLSEDKGLFLEDITKKWAQTWVTERAQAGDGTKTIQRRLSALRNYWGWLQARGHVDRERQPWANVMIPREAQKGPDADRQPFTREQVGALWAACGKDEPLRALIALAGYTGGRIEELCTLTVASVDTTKWTMRLDSKTKAGKREIPIHTHIQPLVTALVSKAQAGLYLIHSTAKNQFGERSVPLGKRFGRLKASTGHDASLVFHSIRKTVATALDDVGCPEPIAAKIMGHAVKTMTYGLYSGGAHMKTLREWLEKAVSIPGIGVGLEHCSEP